MRKLASSSTLAAPMAHSSPSLRRVSICMSSVSYTHLGLTDAQTQAILEMRLRRLTGLERHKLEAELKELKEKID